MRVKILGAGVGAFHYLPDWHGNRYPPAFLVEWGKGEKLLFDCSQAVDQRLESVGVDYASIHHVAISHAHPDHCVLIPFIQSVYLKGLWGGEPFRNNQLCIYGPDSLIENIPTLWNVYIPDREGKYFDWPRLELIPVSTGEKKYTFGDAFLSARPTYHAFGKCDAVAYRLETPEGIMAYSGDTGDCAGVREIARDADLFICEASARVGDFTSPKSYGHLNPYTVGDIAKNANVKKVVLFHYTGFDNDDEIIDDVKKAGFKGEVTMGKDFQEIS